MGKYCRIVLVLVAVAAIAMVGGCSKCGFWLDEWLNAPKSCKGDLPK